jgi:L-asparaginase/Glu-tRNA(Gln) amidotransferase subunit D
MTNRPIHVLDLRKQIDVLKDAGEIAMKSKPTIKIIATGGSIASAGVSSTMTTGYQPGSLCIDAIFCIMLPM